MKTRTLFIMTIFFFFIISKAFPSTIKVTTGTDSIPGSLRDAINKAQSGDVITFDNSLVAIYLGEQITIDKSISIFGNPNLKLHGGFSLRRIFEINGSVAIVVNISNLKFVKNFNIVGDTVSYETDGRIILIKNSQSIVNIDFCYFVSEQLSGGGSIACHYNNNGTVKVFYGQNGGGIAQHGGTLNISNSTFSNLGSSGWAYSGNGGAIYQKLGVLNLTNCTFHKNSPGVSGCGKIYGDGSAIYSENSSVSITNCTFAEHLTHYTQYFTGSPYVYTQNSYTIVLFNSNMAIRNSIFFNNDGNRDIYGSINSGGYNIFGQTSISGSVSSDIFNCNPGFVLNNNTVVLSNGTFWIPVCPLETVGCAIDALPANGNGAPQYDQRGFNRLNTPDIGAFEFGGVISTQTSIENVDQIKIYPNPSSGLFSLQINSQQTHNTVEIFNSLGQRIYIKEIVNNKIEQINLVYKGLYFVKILGKNSIQIKKVIID
jgi:hypothetical protein